MQLKNLLIKHSIILVDGKMEIIKVTETPFRRFTGIWCRHEAECLSKLAELGFESAPKLISASGNSFTMEKIEGKSLNRRRCIDEHLLLRVLAVVHQLHTFGFAHGNLRPSNILITDESKPVLIDFETCCQRRNPLFLLVRFSDHVRLHLLWHSTVVPSTQGRTTTLFPGYVTLAMYVITPLHRFIGILKSIKKKLRKSRKLWAERRGLASGRRFRRAGTPAPRQTQGKAAKVGLKSREQGQ